MSIKNMVARIPRAGIVRLGTPKSENAPGRNVSWFRIESPYFTPEQITEALGDKPTELRIKFPKVDRNDNQKSLEYIFDASYKAYKNGTLFCKGDGESATRAIAKGKLIQVECTCELLSGSKPICKQRGEMKVALSHLPFMGYFQISTTSWNSINSIQSVIDMYYQVLGEKFWITEFILFKEEMFISGRKQYITRLKVANEFISQLPRGCELNAHMMFEDDEPEYADSHEPLDNVKPENDKTAYEELQELENADEASEPLDDSEKESDVSDKGHSDVGQSESEEPDTNEKLPPLEELPPVEEPKKAAPPAKKPPVTSAASPEKSDTTETAKPYASATPASPSEKAVTPARRMKEQRLLVALANYKKLGNFPEEPLQLLQYFPFDNPCQAKSIDELSEQDIQSILGHVVDAVKLNITHTFLTEEDIPY